VFDSICTVRGKTEGFDFFCTFFLEPYYFCKPTPGFWEADGGSERERSEHEDPEKYLYIEQECGESELSPLVCATES
jgi:hypothetical protein